MFVFPAGVAVPLFTEVILDAIVYLVVLLLDDWPEVDDILFALTVLGTFTKVLAVVYRERAKEVAPSRVLCLRPARWSWPSIAPYIASAS